jgi:hypothetical protein
MPNTRCLPLFPRQTDLSVARSAVLGTRAKTVAESFAEERDTGLRDRLYAEFNTLSILYDQLSMQASLHRGPIIVLYAAPTHSSLSQHACLSLTLEPYPPSPWCVIRCN